MNKNQAMYTRNYKIKNPCRDQLEFQISSLDTLLPLEHRARDIWAFVNEMDCRPCFDYLKTYCGCDGRSATSPQVLLALWIYSILDGNISARKLAVLCKEHDAYKWLAGGLSLNRTTLAEFRTNDPLVFEELLTNCLAVLFKAGLIKDTDFAQDGTKIKASAGFNSFRREESLARIKEEIKEYIAALKSKESDDDDNDQNARKRRIADERLKRVDEALEILDKERAIKKENGEKNNKPKTTDELKEVRASTTDPAVRKMKMGDGGYRLAYNVQFATGMDSRVIFGATVVTSLDPGTSPKMMAVVHSRLNKLGMEAPKNWIGDTAYSSKSDLEIVAETFPNCRYYAPPNNNKGTDPKKPQKKDSEAVRQWRDLIDKEEVKEIYKKRCSTAEFSNAQTKQRGWREFVVRGLEKVRSSTLLTVIAQNIMRYFDLREEVAV